MTKILEFLTESRGTSKWGVRRAVGALCVLLAAGTPLFFVGCLGGERADQPSGTESHFLSACDRDTDCGALECLGGVCSLACESHDECTELSDESRCESTSEGRSCVLSCSGDSDCAGVGAEECSGGYCGGHAPLTGSDADDDGASSEPPDDDADDGNTGDDSSDDSEPGSSETAEDIELLQATGERNLQPDVSDEERSAAANDNADFGFELYGLSAARDDEVENLVLSPYSISTAMAMAYAGARGDTESEMAEVLHYRLSQDRLHPAFNSLGLSLESAFERLPNSRLRIHNSLWAQNGLDIEEPFLETLTTDYGSGLFVVDFAEDPAGSRAAINDWVRVRTEDKIPNLLPDGSITENTKLVLTNTIHLLARWHHKFEESATEPAEFSLNADAAVEVDTMYMLEYLDHYAEEGLSVVRLAYEDTRVGMWILLPELGELDALEMSLSAERINTIAESFSRRSVDLALPKFSVTSRYQLKDELSELGMPSAFDDRADFSAISEYPLSISNVYQDAFIGIDEHGTEASAATAVVFGDAGATFFEDIVPFVVDRPFVFLIRDERSKSLLFVGRVTDPR